MYDEIRKKAEKKVEAKMAFFICAIVFGFVTIVLLMIGFYIPSIAFWLKLPIPIFIMVLAILYISAWGLPTDGMWSEDWKEEAIEKEMIKLYRKKKLQLENIDDPDESEYLDLEELEKLEEKWDREDDYV